MNNNTTQQPTEGLPKVGHQWLPRHSPPSGAAVTSHWLSNQLEMAATELEAIRRECINKPHTTGKLMKRLQHHIESMVALEQVLAAELHHHHEASQADPIFHPAEVATKASKTQHHNEKRHHTNAARF